MANYKFVNPYLEDQTQGFSFSNLNSTGMSKVFGGIFSSITGAITAGIQADAQSYVLEVQAQIAELNAKNEHLRANAALDAGNKQVSQITMKYGALKSSQKTAYASNGIKLNTQGSVAEVQTTTDVFKELDAHQAYANGLSAAWGYMNKATAYKNNAIALRASKPNSGMVAFGSLMTGLTNTAKTYQEMQFKYYRSN